MQVYPGVSDRIKAVIADTFILVGMMIIITYIFAEFENVPDNARIIAFIFIFGLYDPLLTSLLGGTLGHMMFGIRVKRTNNESKNILFPLAFLRYVVKASLGWVSLITVSANEKSKAIHDYLVGSVVVYKDNLLAVDEAEA